MSVRLALSGKMRSGKDTAAGYLQAKYGGMNLKFSDPLYEIQDFAQQVCGFPREKDREFLQWIGTEYGRARDENVWLNVLARKLEKIPDSTPVFVTDGRFVNELEFLQAQGFALVKIVRPEADRVAFGATNLTHASELGVDIFNDWDLVVENTGSLMEFYDKMDAIYKELTYGTQKVS